MPGPSNSGVGPAHRGRAAGACGGCGGRAGAGSVGLLCVAGTFGPASTNRGFVRAWAACARRGEGLWWLVPTFRMATQDEADAGAEAEAVQWAKAVTRA